MRRNIYRMTVTFTTLLILWLGLSSATFADGPDLDATTIMTTTATSSDAVVPMKHSNTCPVLEEVETSSTLGDIYDAATSLTEYVLPESSAEPMNILLLGGDIRPGERDGRSDTMILLRIDPAEQRAAMVSIPRDLWVTIPGYGEHRINEAFRRGLINNHPGGGPALAAETVEYNLGVEVHATAFVNFDGFRQAVNALDGIKLCVPQGINAAAYYGYPIDHYNTTEYYSFVQERNVLLKQGEPLTVESLDPTRGYEFLYIEAGYHTLDGDTALRYARSRANVTADFQRVRQQQAVLMAMRYKALQLNIIPRVPELWSAFSENFETTLTLSEVMTLANAAMHIPQENIRMAAISHEHTTGYRTSKGMSVLLPNRPAIQTLITEIFGPTTPEAPYTQAELEAFPELAPSLAAEPVAEAVNP